MLVELAAANAALAVIKEAIGHGKDIAEFGSQLGQFFSAKSEIAKKANQKGSDSEEFWALESIRVQEEELKEMMIYQGRAGLWTDWLAFQSAKKREREQAERERILAVQKRRKALLNVFNGILIAVIVLSGLIAVVGLIWAIAKRGVF